MEEQGAFCCHGWGGAGSNGPGNEVETRAPVDSLMPVRHLHEQLTRGLTM